MKKIIFNPLIMIFWSMTTLLYAQSTIDAQLQAIHNAPASQRVEMMNQFKQRLAQMNEQERAEVITQMRSQMQKQHQMQDQKNSRLEQMKHSENMQRMEQMQQRQHTQQYMKEQMGTHQGGYNRQEEMPNMPYN